MSWLEINSRYTTWQPKNTGDSLVGIFVAVRQAGYFDNTPGMETRSILEKLRYRDVACLRDDAGQIWYIDSTDAVASISLGGLIPGERIRLTFKGDVVGESAFTLELATGTLLGSFHSTLRDLVKALEPFGLDDVFRSAPDDARIRFSEHSMSYGEVRKAAAALRAAKDVLRVR